MPVIAKIAYLNPVCNCYSEQGKAAKREQKYLQAKSAVNGSLHKNLLPHLIRSADDAIPDLKLSAKIESIEKITAEICKSIEKQPALQSSMQKLASYYLPTTVKLLNAHAEVGSLSIESEAAGALKTDIEKSVDTILTGFTSLYENISRYSSLELSAEMEAMTNSFAIDCLLGDSLEIPESAGKKNKPGKKT